MSRQRYAALFTARPDRQRTPYAERVAVAFNIATKRLHTDAREAGRVVVHPITYRIALPRDMAKPHDYDIHDVTVLAEADTVTYEEWKGAKS